MIRKHPFLLLLACAAINFNCTKDPEPPQNKVPTANAGLSSTITLPTNSVNLTGAGSDADGQVVAYLWSQVSGPANTTIVNSGAPSTEVKNFVAGTYIFQLMVTDDKGATGSDTATVIVNPAVIQTVTLQPGDNPTEYQVENLNGQDQTHTGAEISIDQWTTAGHPWTLRNIIKFDLSNIPTTATVISANLYLYSTPKPLTGNQVDANYGPNNSLFLQQVTSEWSPSSLGWFNQPSTNTTTQISIASTTQSTLDLNLDVSDMVKSMVNNNANYGFLLKLQSEVIYNSRIFVSSYNTAYPLKHPKLVVVYK